MAKQINARVITKHDKEDNWKHATNFCPANGEIIVYEADNQFSVPRLKIGDGTNTISNLDFITDPFVLKEEGKGLSSVDFTTALYEKLSNIPEDFSYTDAIYQAGQDIGFDNGYIYNKGVVRITPDIEDNKFIVVYRTGPGEDDIDSQSITIRNNNLNIEEIIQQTVTVLPSYINTGKTEGCISINGNDVQIKGWKDLGSLAFQNSEDLAEILILENENSVEEISDNIKFIYNSNTDILTYKDPSGILVTAFPNTVIDISFKEDDKNTLLITNNIGEYELDLSTPYQNGTNIAEYRKTETLELGYCFVEDISGTMKKSSARLLSGAKVTTDTAAMVIGEKTEEKIPVTISGRVLVYTNEDRNQFNIGDCVCSAPNGRVSRMTREEITQYPECIVGIVSEIPTYTEWQNSISVNDRIWVYIK